MGIPGHLHVQTGRGRLGARRRRPLTIQRRPTVPYCTAGSRQPGYDYKTMQMNSRDVCGVAVVDLVGRLTSSDNAGALGARVARLMAEGHTQVVLNLAQLSYMDSCGLGEMVSCYSQVQKAGGSIRLAQTTARIQDLLALTKLLTVFESYETEDLALASFAQPSTA